ncbi:hypothetical protein K461DRAFT_298066 [Myriangium duriaei CBS 260.36]|uniref:Uncharacterized protein n=1 Tax=Myriangium duriaei CBS 260.36 TaxID=1168546 RepID=A0A9P4ISN8_9PEZI|nr:hypothetical protein K461DRAFT_298066 [Myriangium duriaei CBS 260.36]
MGYSRIGHRDPPEQPSYVMPHVDDVDRASRRQLNIFRDQVERYSIYLDSLHSMAQPPIGIEPRVPSSPPRPTPPLEPLPTMLLIFTANVQALAAYRPLIYSWERHYMDLRTWHRDQKMYTECDNLEPMLAICNRLIGLVTQRAHFLVVQACFVEQARTTQD